MTGLVLLTMFGLLSVVYSETAGHNHEETTWLTFTCDNQEVFCLRRKTCVPVRCQPPPDHGYPDGGHHGGSDGHQNDGHGKCEQGWVFCLRRKTCVPVRCEPPPDHGYPDGGHHGGSDGHYGGSDGHQNNGHGKCDQGWIFCLRRKSCVPVHCPPLGNGDSGDYGEHHGGNHDNPEGNGSSNHGNHGQCPSDMVLCLKTGSCVPKAGCDHRSTPPGSPGWRPPTSASPGSRTPPTPDPTPEAFHEGLCPVQTGDADCSAVGDDVRVCTHDGNCDLNQKCCEDSCDVKRCQKADYLADIVSCVTGDKPNFMDLRSIRITGDIDSVPLQLNLFRATFPEENINLLGDDGVKSPLFSDREFLKEQPEEVSLGDPISFTMEKYTEQDGIMNIEESSNGTFHASEKFAIQLSNNEDAGVVLGTVSVLGDDENALRVYQFKGIIFPENEEPSVEWLNNSDDIKSLTMFEDGTLDLNLTEVLLISDPTSRELSTISGANIYTLMRQVNPKQAQILRKCALNYNQHVINMIPAPVKGVFMYQYPDPQTVDDIVGSWESIDAYGNRRPAKSRGQYAAYISGDQQIRFRPKPDVTGLVTFKVVATDGSRMAQALIGNRYMSAHDFEATIENSAYVGNTLELNIEIEDANDAPVFNFPKFYSGRGSQSSILTIPYNLDEYEGFLVKDLAFLYYSDADSERLGMVVVKAQNKAGLGTWEYETGDGNWQSLDVVGPDNINLFSTYSAFSRKGTALGSDNHCTTSDGFKLNPDSKIRFNLDNSDVTTARVGKDELPIIAFVPHDLSDDTAEGDLISVCSPICYDCDRTQSTGSVTVIMSVERAGCDGRPSSGKTEDQCGQCGGRNSCLRNDCNGVPGGDARLDACNECTGGDTGLETNNKKDCFGRCGGLGLARTVNIDGKNLDLCLHRDISSEKWLDDNFETKCDGRRNSTAKEDCGGCILGNTGNTKDTFRDVCGQCLNENLTLYCTDCTGTPYGDSTVDRCGDCKKEDDTTRNKGLGCDEAALAEFSTTQIWNGQSEIIYVYGVQLETLSIVTGCFLISQDSETPEEHPIETANWNVGRRREKRLLISTPESLTPGTYKVSCSFMTQFGQEIVKESSGILTVIGDASVQGIDDSTMTKGEVVSRQITGSGFNHNTQVYLLCPWDNPIVFYSIPACRNARRFIKPTSNRKIRVVPLEKTLESAESMIVSLKELSDIVRPLAVTLAVFPTTPSKLEQIESATSIEVTVEGTQPSVDGSEFSKNLCKLKVVFNMNTEGAGQRKCHQQDIRLDDEAGKLCCSDIFDNATVAKLGEETKCGINGRTLRIRLDSETTIRPGDPLVFRDNSIQEKGITESGAAAKYVTGSITTPDVQNIPTVELKAPNQIGSCATLRVSARARNIGCGGQATYHWSIDISPDDMSEITTDDIAALGETQTTLESTNERYIIIDNLPPGHIYVITLFVENYLGATSEEVQHIVEKSVDNQPVTMTIHGDDIVDPDGVISLTTKLTLSRCASAMFSDTFYQYSVEEGAEPDDFSLENIRGRSMKLDGSRRGVILRGNTTYSFGVRGTFVVASFCLKVTLTMTDGNTISIFDTKTVTTTSKELEPKIAGLINFKHGTTQGLLLDGSQSKDPDNSLTEPVFSWTCDYLNSEDNVCFGHDFIPLQPGFAQESVLAIQGGKLPLGDYRFCLVMFVDDRKASTCVEVQVTSSNPPEVKVSFPEERIDPADGLIIDARVCSDSRTEIEWFSQEAPGSAVLDLTSNCVETSVIKEAYPRCKSVPLICHTLNPSSQYTFQLEAQHIDSNGNDIIDDGGANSAQVNVNASTDGEPIISRISVDPVEGNALETNFLLIVEAVPLVEEDRLTYQFIYKDGTEMVELTGQQDLSDYPTTLPEGTGTVCVRVCNQKGLCAIAEYDGIITVTSQGFNMTTFIQCTQSQDDPVTCCRQIEPWREEIREDPELDQQVASICEGAASKQISSVNIQDPQAPYVYERGIETVSTERAPGTEILELSYSVMRELLEGLAGNEEVARRKRGTPEEPESLTADMVESLLLASYGIQFAGIEDSEIPKDTSVNFYADLDTNIIGMCRGLVMNQPAITAKKALGVVSAVWKPFDGIAGVQIDIAGCDGCENFINTSAAFIPGEGLQDDFALWNCTDGEQCEGACIGTAQIPRDVRTTGTDNPNPLISNKRSDIIYVTLVNPSDKSIIDFVNLTTPYSIDIPITGGDFNLTLYSLQCRVWFDDDWNAGLCESSEPMDSADGPFVSCSCTTTGSIGVFEADPVKEAVETTMSITTLIEITEGETYMAMSTFRNVDDESIVTTDVPTSQQVSTEKIKVTMDGHITSEEPSTEYDDSGEESTEQETTEPSVTTGTESSNNEETTVLEIETTTKISHSSVSVKFKFNADYDAVVGRNNSQFKAHLKPQIAAKMGVAEKRITNLMVEKGSILVLFDLLNDDSGSSLEDIIAIFQAAVQGGTLNITDTNGNTLAVNTTFFDQVFTATTPSTDRRPTTTQDPSPFSQIGAAIGSVLGAILMVIIIIIIILVIIKVGERKRVAPNKDEEEGEDEDSDDVYSSETWGPSGTSNVRKEDSGKEKIKMDPVLPIGEGVEPFPRITRKSSRGATPTGGLVTVSHGGMPSVETP